MCSKQQEINYYFISWIQVLVCMGGNRERNLRGGKKFEKEIQAANTNLPISITIKAMDHIKQLIVCPNEIMCNRYSS